MDYMNTTLEEYTVGKDKKSLYICKSSNSEYVSVVPIVEDDGDYSFVASVPEKADYEDLIKILDYLINITNADNKLVDKTMLLRVLYEEIKEIADEVCKKLDVKYNKIEICDAYQLASPTFAQCDSKEKVLKFYWRLIEVPKSVLKVIVTHEVCHLKIGPHNSEFWAMLLTHCKKNDLNAFYNWQGAPSMNYFLNGPSFCYHDDPKGEKRVEFYILPSVIDNSLIY